MIDLVALLQRHLQADDDGLLADIEVAEAADQAHAVELAGLFLEAADQQHVAVGLEFLVLASKSAIAAVDPVAGICRGFAVRNGRVLCARPFSPPRWVSADVARQHL